MVDVTLMSPKFRAPITSVDLLDANTRTGVIRGKNFQNVTKIIFSGVEIKNFTVLSTQELHFTLPPPPLDLNKPVVVLIEATETLLDGSLSSSIDISLNPTKSVSGFSRVLQKFLKILLTEKGSNFFNRTEGTNLVRMVGSNFTEELDIDLEVDSAFRQLKDQQFAETLPASEIVTNVSVTRSYFDPRRASINIELEVETADGLARFTEVVV